MRNFFVDANFGEIFLQPQIFTVEDAIVGICAFLTVLTLCCDFLVRVVSNEDGILQQLIKSINGSCC